MGWIHEGQEWLGRLSASSSISVIIGHIRRFPVDFRHLVSPKGVVMQKSALAQRLTGLVIG